MLGTHVVQGLMPQSFLSSQSWSVVEHVVKKSPSLLKGAAQPFYTPVKYQK